MTPVLATSAGADDKPGRRQNALADMIPRLYRTYGYQFSSSYRHPVAQFLQASPPTSRRTGGDASDDDAATVSVLQQQTSLPVRRADRADRTSKRLSKRVIASHR